MEFRNYIPPDGGHAGCGIWQSRSLVRDSGSKSNKWTKRTTLRRRVEFRPKNKLFLKNEEDV